MLLDNPALSKSLPHAVVRFVPNASSVEFVHVVLETLLHSPVSQLSMEGTIDSLDESVARGTRPAILMQSPPVPRASDVRADVHFEDIEILDQRRRRGVRDTSDYVAPNSERTHWQQKHLEQEQQ